MDGALHADLREDLRTAPPPLCCCEWAHCPALGVLHTKPRRMGALVLRSNKNKTPAEVH